MTELTAIRVLFFFNDPATTGIYTLSLHDALPIWSSPTWIGSLKSTLSTDTVTHGFEAWRIAATRSEEHTSELQSQSNLVCRLLLEKKKTPPWPCVTGSSARPPRSASTSSTTAWSA